MRWIADTTGAFEEERSTKIDPLHPQDPGLAKLFDLNRDEDLDITVDEDSALYCSAVFSAVLLISETLASVPLKCYVKKEDDSRAPSKHPVGELFSWSPNGVVPTFHFIETLTAHACTFGHGFAEIVWGRNNFPQALWPLDPRYTEPVKLPSGEVGYVHSPPGRPPQPLRAREVLHVRGPCFDTINAYPRVRMAAKAIGLAMAAEGHAARWFRDGAAAPVAFEHPGQLSPSAHERIEKSIERKRGKQGHQPWVLEEGMKANVIGVDPEKSQLRDTRAFQVIEVARFYRVFPHLLMDLDRATFSNIEELMLAFVRLTMLAWARRWEAELNFKLLPNSPSYLEFMFDGLERGALLQRLTAYRTGREIGLYSLNDLLRKENMPTIGPDGDIRLYPLNHGIVGQEGDAQPTSQPGSGDDSGSTTPPTAGSVDSDGGAEVDDETMRSLLPFAFDAHQRLYRRHASALQRAGKRLSENGDRAEFGRWVARYVEETRSVFGETIAPLAASVAEVLGAPNNAVREHIQQRAQTMAEELRDTLGVIQTLADVRPLLDEMEQQLPARAHDEMRFARQALSSERNRKP